MTARTYANLTIWMTFIGAGLGWGAIYIGFREMRLYWAVWGSIYLFVSTACFLHWWPDYKRDFDDDHD